MWTEAWEVKEGGVETSLEKGNYSLKGKYGVKKSELWPDKGSGVTEQSTINTG